MTAPEKRGSDGEGAPELAHLVQGLHAAIAEGDMRGAQDAHAAIGRGLETASEQPSVVVDLNRERARRRRRRARRSR
jgi:hypothetical protein